MDRAFATIRDGQVSLDTPVGWPEGTRLEVRPLEAPSNGNGSGGEEPSDVRPEFREALCATAGFGLDESLWPLSPGEIRVLLEHMDAAEALDLSPEEIKTWDAELAESKQQQKELTRKSWETLESAFP